MIYDLRRLFFFILVTNLIIISNIFAADRADASDVSGTSPAERIESRSFPSIFQAWNQAENLNSGPSEIVELSTMEKPEASMARHDLAFVGWETMGLKSAGSYKGLALDFNQKSIQKALAKRNRLLSLNPHMVLLASVQYHSAWDGYFPDDSPWWKRDGQGSRVPASTTNNGKVFLLDPSNPDFQQQVAQQCEALVKTGVFDGCMFDWWSHETSDRVELIQKVRAAVGDDAVLIVNANGTVPKESAPYINGIFMEGYPSTFKGTWQTAIKNLTWGTAHFHTPAILAFEGWYQNSRNDYALMRQVTTLGLVFSNGYVLFGDPNLAGRHGHLHDIYPFWDKKLGRASGPMGQNGTSGSFIREYDKGTALFNPPTNQPIQIHFNNARTSVSTGNQGQDFQVDSGDGDIFLN